MCVAQFREYCKASSFKYSDRSTDLSDKNLRVREGTYRYVDKSYYYVTNIKELKRLAENGNEYAKKELKTIFLTKQ